MNIRVFTAFSGYDSQCMALERVKARHPGFGYELVGWSEIDKNAIRLHDACFPEYSGRNYGDISRIDWCEVPDFDLFTYSFPCTDISMAGLRQGLSEGSGTHSSLLWECRKAISVKRPKWLLMENVKALTFAASKPYLRKWEQELAAMGYDNYVKVLNATDFNVPQNRERVFMVSVRRDGEPGTFHFPTSVPLTRTVADILEERVDERYYMSEKMLAYFERVTADKTHNHRFKPNDGSLPTCTVTTDAGAGWTATTSRNYEQA